MQKPIAFLYINKKLSQGYLKTMLFIIVSKRIKYLRKNLTKEMKDIHTKNN